MMERDALSGERGKDRRRIVEFALVVAALMLAATGLIVGGIGQRLVLGAMALAAAATWSALRRAAMLGAEVRSGQVDYRRLLDLPTQIFFVSDAAGHNVMIGERWTEWTGLTPEQSFGGMWNTLVHADDQSRVIAARANAMSSGQPLDEEFRIRMKSGHYRWMRLRVFPHREGKSAAASGWVGSIEDIHERRVAEEQLRQTATLLEMIGTSTESIIYAKDVDGRMLYVNRALERLANVTLGDILGKTDAEWNPNPVEAEAFAASDRAVIASGIGQDLEEVFTGGGGTTRHYRSLKNPLRDRSGQVIGVVGISTDVTEVREAEERERLLARELDHRAKNLLAVVQSVVQLTRADDLDGFKAAVEGRIQALGRAHSMLAASRWDGADLQRILAEELAPFGDADHGRVHLAGPPLLLKPAAAQSFALVAHELATNAAKYGALSSPDGRLDVRWDIATATSEEILRLTWSESGGPAVAPPGEHQRVGFGSRLIRTSIERQLAGKLDLDWATSGLEATLTVPLDRSIPRREEVAAKSAKVATSRRRSGRAGR